MESITVNTRCVFGNYQACQIFIFNACDLEIRRIGIEGQIRYVSLYLPLCNVSHVFLCCKGVFRILGNQLLGILIIPAQPLVAKIGGCGNRNIVTIIIRIVFIGIVIPFAACARYRTCGNSIIVALKIHFNLPKFPLRKELNVVGIAPSTAIAVSIRNVNFIVKVIFVIPTHEVIAFARRYFKIIRAIVGYFFRRVNRGAVHCVIRNGIRIRRLVCNERLGFPKDFRSEPRRAIAVCIIPVIKSITRNARHVRRCIFIARICVIGFKQIASAVVIIVIRIISDGNLEASIYVQLVCIHLRAVTRSNNDIENIAAASQRTIRTDRDTRRDFRLTKLIAIQLPSAVFIANDLICKGYAIRARINDHTNGIPRDIRIVYVENLRLFLSPHCIQRHIRIYDFVCKIPIQRFF